MSVVLYSVGHGSRTVRDFLALLAGAGICRLVDVRSLPGSRKHPQFNRENLEATLGEAGIEYRFEGEALGGFRKLKRESVHLALRSPGFRVYADWMETAEFRAGADRLLQLGQKIPTAFMCAERLPWRCHRYLLSDFLTSRGACVRHLIESGKSLEHRLRPGVFVDGFRLIYADNPRPRPCSEESTI